MSISLIKIETHLLLFFVLKRSKNEFSHKFGPSPAWFCKKNAENGKKKFLDFLTLRGGRPPIFGGRFFGPGVEIWKSLRTSKLYGPNLQNDTPYDQIEPVVWSVWGVAPGFGPSTSYILVFSVHWLPAFSGMAPCFRHRKTCLGWNKHCIGVHRVFPESFLFSWVGSTPKPLCIGN